MDLLQFEQSNKSSDASTLERAKSLCNIAIFTVSLQYRRLQTAEPEDKAFIFRELADFHFMITALIRLRTSAKIAARVPYASKIINRAIKQFDGALPALIKMRDVLEHIDDYALDKGRHTDVQRQQLQVTQWGSAVYSWLGEELNVDDALAAAEKLFRAVVDVVKLYSNPSVESTKNLVYVNIQPLLFHT